MQDISNDRELRAALDSLPIEQQRVIGARFACSVVLAPEGLSSKISNIAWKAAIHVRMAENCLMMGTECGNSEGQTRRQYEIARKFS